MDYYFVDFENVKSDGIKDLKDVNEGDFIVFFYSEKCKNLSLDVLDSIIKKKLKFQSFKVNVGTKNALDFQLVTYLGSVIGEYRTDAQYHIVSNDKGFVVVADFWKEQGISVDCISLCETTNEGNKAAKTTTKKKSKVAVKDLATIDEVKALVGKGKDADEVLKIFNQYKTKVSINNGLVKYYKDTKKASATYKKLKPLLKSKNKT